MVKKSFKGRTCSKTNWLYHQTLIVIKILLLQYIFNISQFFCKRISNTKALNIRSFLINYFFISDGKTEDNQSSFSVLPTFLFHTVGPIMEIQNLPLRNVISGFLQCPVEIIEQVGFIPSENNRKPKVFWYFQSVLIMY